MAHKAVTEVQQSWLRIAARVHGLSKAGAIFIDAQKVHTEDPYGVSHGVFKDQARQILTEVSAYQIRYAGALTPEALAALDRFLKADGLSRFIRDDGISGLNVMKTALPILEALVTEVEYLLADDEQAGSRLTERAFGHLQRTIAVVPDQAKLWSEAFQKNEMACERLGALHLLQFGIFAFKLHAEGGRTDLVFGEPLDEADPLIGTASVIVQTEWKLVRKGEDHTTIAAKARSQIQAYASGPLLGLELRRHKYIVLVSAEQLPSTDDVEAGGIVFRHLNVAVSPKLPSKN